MIRPGPHGRAWFLLAIVAVSLLSTGCGSFLGGLANRVEEPEPRVVPSPASIALHGTLVVADLHADPLLLGRDLLIRSPTEHVDIPRLIKGNIALQGFGVVTQVPRDITSRRFDLAIDADEDDGVRDIAKLLHWPEETRESPLARALYMAAALAAFDSRAGSMFQIIRSQQQLQAYLTARQGDPETAAGFLSLEGAHALEGSLGNLPVLFDAGFRVLGLVHFHDNDVGGSTHGVDRGGLTPFGLSVVNEAAQLRMIVDLAHASPTLIDDVLAAIGSMPASERPGILVSHTGVQATCPNERNLSDGQIQQIAAAEGVIGIGLFEFATCGRAISHTVDAIQHVVSLVGAEYVALGSDWDGFVTVPIDASDVVKITHALAERGLPPDAIARIMGGNVIELFERGLPSQ